MTIWRPPGRYGASTRPMVAYSGFAWSHRYAPSGDVARFVSPRRHGCRNRRWIRYIVYNRVANKWINSLTFNGLSYIASTTPPPDPFERGYARLIGRAYPKLPRRMRGKRHHHGGDVCDCCVCGVESYYSYCRILRGFGVFSTATGLAVKLLNHWQGHAECLFGIEGWHRACIAHVRWFEGSICSFRLGPVASQWPVPCSTRFRHGSVIRLLSWN